MYNFNLRGGGSFAALAATSEEDYEEFLGPNEGQLGRVTVLLYVWCCDYNVKACKKCDLFSLLHNGPGLILLLPPGDNET